MIDRPGEGAAGGEPEDEDFRSAMSDVAPLTAKAKKQAQHREQQLESQKELPRSITPQQLEARDNALGINRQPAVDPNSLTLGEVPPIAPLEVLEWKKDGVQHQVFQRLKAGGYPIEGSLDLHRLTVKEARIAVYRFFALAEVKRWRTILIAHGRGERSATPGRLKSYVAHWLGQSPSVIAWSSADRRHGGTGAVLVLLKKSAAAKEATREAFGQKSDPGDVDF